MTKNRKIEITWRGSVTDLATDIAYLLTPDQGRALTEELSRFQRTQKQKFCGSLECTCERSRGEGTIMVRAGCPVHSREPLIY